MSTRVTVIFNDQSGKAISLQGGEQGMDFGIDNIPGNAGAEDALDYVFSSFAAYDYSISDIDFSQVTFKYALADGTPQEQKFTKDELRKKQLQCFCRF